MSVTKFAAFRSHLDVVGALMLRDVRTRYSKSILGYFWAFAEPSLHLIWIAGVSYFLERASPFGYSRVVFVASGLLPLFVFIRVSTKITAATAKQTPIQGVGISAYELGIAKAVLEGLTMVVVMVVAFAGMYWWGLEEASPARFETFLVSLLCFFTLGVGFGFANGAIARIFPTWVTIYGLLARVMIFLSGVIRIFDYYPSNIRDIAYYVPTLHGVTLARVGFYGETYPQLIFDSRYLAAAVFISLFIGLFMNWLLAHKSPR